MWSDRVSNLGPLALEYDALPTALRGPDTCDLFPRITNLPIYKQYTINTSYLQQTLFITYFI